MKLTAFIFLFAFFASCQSGSPKKDSSSGDQTPPTQTGNSQYQMLLDSLNSANSNLMEQEQMLTNDLETIKGRKKANDAYLTDSAYLAIGREVEKVKEERGRIQKRLEELKD